MQTLPHLTSSVVDLFSCLRNNSGIRVFWDRIPYFLIFGRSAITIWSVTTALRHFLDEQKRDALPKSPWGQAVNYALNQWDDLCLFTTLGSLAIDNNVAERSLRGIALGRKNWLFVGSRSGGNTAAILFSILASCKRHQVEPWAYLRDVLQRLATPCSSEKLRQLFPHRWKPNSPTR